jgi:hypothetical protein
MSDETTTTPSLRDTLTAAYDKQVESATAAPAPVEKTETAPPAPAEKTVSVPPPVEGRDEKGRFTSKPAATIGVKEPTGPALGTPAAEGAATGTPPPVAAPSPSTTEPELRAPKSWRPLAREKWDQVPVEVRQEAIRREGEINRALNETAEARKNWTRFQEAVRPFEGVMRANGTTDPVQSAANLFQTAATLQLGTQPQKAAVLAQVITQFGVDVGLLASYLQGQPATTMQAPEYRDPRVDTLLQRIESAMAERTKSQETRLHQELESFAEKAEFFEDDRIRETMADIVEVWDKQGKLGSDADLSKAVQEAYNRAVLLHDDIAQVYRQREAAKEAAAAQAKAQQARAAASSVRSTPSVAGTPAQPKDRRAALERAYDEQVNRRT